jgi:hypothetical protein
MPHAVPTALANRDGKILRRRTKLFEQQGQFSFTFTLITYQLAAFLRLGEDGVLIPSFFLPEAMDLRVAPPVSMNDVL